MPKRPGTPEKFAVEELPGELLAVLRVRAVKLTIEDLEPFRRAGRALLDSALPRLAVDFSRVEQVFSVYIGALVDLTELARKRGRAFVVLVRPHVAGMFERMKMGKLIALHVVEPSGA